MAKSRAEIQKAYRERKKAKEGDKFLKKEASRVMKYYVPSTELPERERKKRNSIAAVRNRKHRQLKKVIESQDAEAESEELTSESGYDSSRLVVKLPFGNQPSTSRSTKKRRTARALLRANRKCKTIEGKVQTLKRKFKTSQKTIQRLRAKLKQVTAPFPVAASTPKSKTNSLIESLNLTPTRAKSVKRQILLGNVLIDEISESKEKKEKKSSAISIVAGRITKKYRCISILSKSTKIASRKTISKYADKKSVLKKVTRRCQKEVIGFLNRTDNSRTNPGKRDVKKCDGEKQQTKVLTDYLSNLHQKFLAENPNFVLSLASFCRLRPKYILPVKFTSRQSCLCVKHQNAALKLQAIRKLGVSVSENPEDETDLDKKIDDLVAGIGEDVEINYNEWKRVDTGQMKKMKIVNQNKLKLDFVKELKEQFLQFYDHVRRMKEQFSQMRHLKENLPPHHVVVQMDFAENYVCRSVDEIQSAYWHQTSVTIHPAVVYYRNEHGLQHQSYIVISDELAHNANTVWAILDILIPKLKSIDNNLSCIHYWTDSPSSQYRNKHIFHVITKHNELYGLSARWNYFEAGHGKGPCDGLGGTTKRLADEAMRMKAAVIQDASDFYVWAANSSMKQVEFLWLGKETCLEKQKVSSALNLRPIKGTMKYHAVASINNSILSTKETSCYCGRCLRGEICDLWTNHNVGLTTENVEYVERGETAEEEQGSDPEMYNVNEFVACVYENAWYIGKILGIDNEDDEYEVSFMIPSKHMFKWPASPDEIWVAKADILCKIPEPIANGKSSRFYKISTEDQINVENYFEKHMSARK